MPPFEYTVNLNSFLYGFDQTSRRRCEFDIPEVLSRLFVRTSVSLQHPVLQLRFRKAGFPPSAHATHPDIGAQGPFVDLMKETEVRSSKFRTISNSAAHVMQLD